MRIEEIHILILAGAIERKNDHTTVIAAAIHPIQCIHRDIHITIITIHIAVIQETNSVAWLIILHIVCY